MESDQNFKLRTISFTVKLTIISELINVIFDNILSLNYLCVPFVEITSDQSPKAIAGLSYMNLTPMYM